MWTQVFRRWKPLSPSTASICAFMAKGQKNNMKFSRQLGKEKNPCMPATRSWHVNALRAAVLNPMWASLQTQAPSLPTTLPCKCMLPIPGAVRQEEMDGLGPLLTSPPNHPRCWAILMNREQKCDLFCSDYLLLPYFISLIRIHASKGNRCSTWKVLLYGKAWQPRWAKGQEKQSLQIHSCWTNSIHMYCPTRAAKQQWRADSPAAAVLLQTTLFPSSTHPAQAILPHHTEHRKDDSN